MQSSDPNEDALSERVEMTSSQSRQPLAFKTSRWRHWIALVVVLSTLTAVGVIGYNNWDEYRVLLSTAGLLPLGGAILVGIAGQALNSAIAQKSLAEEGASLPLTSVFRLNAIAGLAKYVPGGVWQIGSQAALGGTAGLRFRHSMMAWIEPTAFNITVGGAIALLAATQVGYGISASVLLAAALLAFLASTNPARYAVYRLVRLVPKDRKSPPLAFKGWPTQVILTVLVIALTGLGGLLVTVAFDTVSNPGYVGSVAAFVGAWVVGFLAFPVPGGIGVREGVLVLALAPWMPPLEAVLIAAASRLVATAAELASGLIGLALPAKPDSTVNVRNAK